MKFPKCDCISNTNKDLAEMGATRIAAKTIFDQTGSPPKFRKTGAWVATYLDGSKKPREKRFEVYASYCPFCGVAYEEDKVNG